MYKDITGKKYGRWTAKSFSFSSVRGEAFWNCVCTCGTKGVVKLQALQTRHSKSCGCYHKAVVTTNGGYAKHPLYRVWVSIRQKCNNPKAEAYKDYGGRGIRVHGPWERNVALFIKFVLKHLGPRPSPRHSIDRKNNDGNYSPRNIRWATWEEQARNRRPVRCLDNYSDTEILREIRKRGL